MGDTIGMREVLHRCWLIALLLGAFAPAAPAMQGQPLSRRYSVADHGGQPGSLNVVVDDRGFVFSANGAGLLRFDGSQWDLVPLPGDNVPRSVHIDPGGQLFVGSYDLFGRIDLDATGALNFVDLRGEFGLDQGTAAFEDVWDIVSTSEGTYFRTDPMIFFLGKDGRRLKWPSDGNVRRLGVLGDKVYARVHGQGFSRLEQGRFELVPGGEVFRERGLVGMLATQPFPLLVAPDGFYELTGDGVRRRAGVPPEALSGAPANTALRLADGSLLFGTDEGTLRLLAPNLALVAEYPIGKHAIQDLVADREGGVWVASSGELVRVRLPSPWSAYTTDDGLFGTIFDTAFYDGALWVATSAGVYRGQAVGGKAVFRREIDTELEAYSLLADDAGLLVAERLGFQLYRTGQPLQLLLESDASELKRSKFDEHLVFGLSTAEIVLFRREDDSWAVQQRWPLGEIGLSALIETAPGEVWIGNWRGAAQRWRWDPEDGRVIDKTLFGREQGLDADAAFGVWLTELDGRIYAISGARVFKLEGDRFVSSNDPPFSLVGKPQELGIAETEFGDFAFDPHQLFHRIPGTRDWQVLHLGHAMANGISNIQTDEDGKLRAISWGGVLQFDPNVAEAPLAPLQVELRSLLLRRGDGTINRIGLTEQGPFTLQGGDALVFDYGMVSMAPGSEFRYRIEGRSDVWSDWNTPSRPALVMNSPGAGVYTLVVEGRTRSGRLAEPLRHRFEIAPLWWQTDGAKVAAVFLALLLLILGSHAIARFRYRQYLALNRRLESKIVERTAELELANRKLAELATEDSLTGVANRRALEQAMHREWERCGALGHSLAMVMIDVDNFKQFNDRYGHLEGDQQLVRVAQELARRVQPVRELLARFGGEEFAIVMPGIEVEEAMARAELMRAAFDREGSATTVSIGVSAEVPSEGRAPADLIYDADMALYAAKRAGRNRVQRAA